MRIILFGTSGILNYGTSMLTTNLMEYLSKFFPEIQWFVDAKGAGRLKYLRNETNQNIKDFSLYTKKTSKISKLFSFLNSEKKFKELQLDSAIFLSGDSISETYGLKGLFYYLTIINNLKRANVSVFFVSQTMGPFFNWRRFLVKRIIEDSPIYTRDPINYWYLKNELKFSNVTLASDLGFLDLYKQNDQNHYKILDDFHLKKNDYVTLVPSGLARHYCNNLTSYINNWVGVIEKLSFFFNYKKKIVLLPHVLESSADDRRIISEITKKLDKRNIEMCTVIDRLLELQEARIILGNGLFTITGRMHAAISTFQMLKPAISLSYSMKYRGVIGEGLGMRDLVIEAKGDDLWESGKIVDMVIDKVNYVLNNYNELIERIKPAVEKSKKMALGQIKDIAEKLKSDKK